ncbi:class I SAM-dependent methyltransferase [Alphaproteobacteria bacterium]|nr:class I SAM-dependent methyltransferase [Alphaproteobacteria bacterium]
MKEIKICEVCDNNELKEVIDLGLHPMCDDLKKIPSDEICKNYPIKILFCSKCLTAHQKYQVPKLKLFPSTYHYRAKFTSDVLKGMKNLVEDILISYPNLNRDYVLDIGCNDGSLLNFFHEKGFSTVGVEPTNAAIDAVKNKHRVYKEYFSNKIARKIRSEIGSPSIITFTNVFAHIENLKEVVKALNTLMGDDTELIIENHYLGSIIDYKQFDTFYHEHPRTYSATSFSYIAKNLNCNIKKITFPSRYGGNIRVFLSKIKENQNVNDNNLKNILSKEKRFSNEIILLNKQVEHWITNKKNYIDALYKKHGSLHAKAFPGRAAILIKLLDIDNNNFKAVYEKPGSFKIDHYIPGTKIPIKSDDELKFINKNVPIINLAWHIPEEIRQYLEKLNISNPIIDIISKNDFN